MMTVIMMRLKLMYEGWSVKVLAGLMILLIISLVNGLYAGSEDASKLRIGIHFEQASELTQEIFDALNATDILIATKVTYEDGVQAVKESRLQGLFVFDASFEQALRDGEYEEVIDLYFLDENYLPYLLTDIVGSKVIGEISLIRGFEYIEGAFDEVDYEPEEGLYERLYEENKVKLHIEKDNFFVEKNLLAEDGSIVDYVALSNVLLFKQVLLGVIYIFLAFYMMFLVVNIVRDYEVGVSSRWQLSRLSIFEIYFGDFVAVLIGSMPLIIVISLLQFRYEGHLMYFLYVNILFLIAYGGLLFLLGKMFSKVTVFVLVTTGIILLLGIISGSFFALDTSQTLVLVLSFLVPSYHLLGEIVRVDVIQETWPSVQFISYMVIYGMITWLCAYLVGKKRRY